MPESWDEPSPWASDEPNAPGLIGASSNGWPETPPDGSQPVAQVVYLPAKRYRPGDTTAQFELRYLDDGRPALLAYSSLDLLVAGCGDAQPWVAVRLETADGLDQLAQICGAVALWDVNIPAEARHGMQDGASDA
jgi:hypothetical protein